jgi:hypothetical protein
MQQKQIMKVRMIPNQMKKVETAQTLLVLVKPLFPHLGQVFLTGLNIRDSSSEEYSSFSYNYIAFALFSPERDCESVLFTLLY